MMMSFILVMGHIIYLPVYLGLSLQREKHTMHHWLHNPLPGLLLIATKMLNGLLSYVSPSLSPVCFSSMPGGLTRVSSI